MSARCEVGVERDGERVVRCHNEGAFEVTSWGVPHVGEPLWCCYEHAREARDDGAGVDPPIPADDDEVAAVVDGWREWRASLALGGGKA